MSSSNVYLLRLFKRWSLHVSSRLYSSNSFHLQVQQHTRQPHSSTPRRTSTKTPLLSLTLVLRHTRSSTEVVLEASVESNGALDALSATKDGNVLNDAIGLVSKVTGHAERAVVVGESDHRSGRLLDAVTVIEVQRASSLVRSVRRDPQHKVLLPQLGSRVCGFSAQRQDGSAADVEGDGVETDVGQVDHASVSLDALAGPVVVEDFVGEVDGYGGGVLFQHGRDEDGVAVEELVFDCEGVGVGGVVEPQGVQAGLSGGGLAVEGSVKVVEQPVAYGNSILGCCGGQGPAVVLLID